MSEPAFEAYVDAFESRCASAEGPGGRRVDEPGLRGLIQPEGAAGSQLLVLDDGALDVLAATLPLIDAGTVRVHEAAPRCADLVRKDRSWRPKDVTAMVCADLSTVPEPLLPDGLTLRPVRRLPQEPDDGVPLTAVVAAAVAAAPVGEIAPARLLAYLTSLPPGPRLLAAVDADGAVCGTSASQNFSTDAYVFLVNTHPGWRRRGVGRAMTAAALHSAMDAGATRACLDASGAGIPLYEQLGFTAAGRITQFSRTPT